MLLVLVYHGLATVLTSKLSKQREAHSDRPDFSWEDFGNVEVHGSITECSGKVSECIACCLAAFLPLECQIQEHEKNTESVTNPVGSTGVFGRHGCQARGSDDNTDKASDVHASSRVDLVMEPGSERVIN